MKMVLVPRSPMAIDQVPPGVREAIYRLFTSHAWPASKCDRMLENLLPYTHVEQLSGYHNDRYAKISLYNLLKIYRADRTMQETCCYQTLHTFVRLLCSLGLLKKQQSSNQSTTYLLPLDPEYCFQNSPTILVAVDRLCDPQQTKNAKMRRKARDVKFRLLCMNSMAQSKMSANLTAFPVALPTILLENIRNLVDSLHLSSRTTITLAQKVTEICATILSQESTDGDSVRVETTSPADLPDEESTRYGVLVDSSFKALTRESTGYDALVDSLSVPSKQRCSSFEHERPAESTSGEKNLRNGAPSSIDVYTQKDSSQKEFELESKTDELWTGSEEELSQEAVRYLRLLDGPEYATPDYLNTHAGKKALGGYKNKIRRSPQLARIAAINTLLQRTFYDLTKQKKPLENAGKWFHSSFDRYADQHRPMEVIGEILDWAKSPYTLEEVATVIPRERKRQETQWWSSRLHLPFTSCVALYHHLPDKVSEVQGSLPEENQGVVGAQLHVEEPAGLSTICGMNCIEAEHLADEIRQEASCYLDRIQVSSAPHLDGNAYVVEAYITDTLFPVTYTTHQDWLEDHQHQVNHRIREQQRGEIDATHPS